MTRIIAAAVLLLGATIAEAQTITGAARVLDGDTLEIQGQRIRLWGIDAPEIAQMCDWYGKERACGYDAKQVLVGLTGQRTTTCEQVDRDRYNRIVARCFAPIPPDGQKVFVDGKARATVPIDLGAELVRQGWAVDYERYSRGAYAKEQAAAKAERAGTWSGRFAMPADYRKGAR